MKKCKNCSAEMPEESKFCPECGDDYTSESKKCKNCSAENPRKANFCIACGNGLTANAKVQPQKSALKMSHFITLVVVSLLSITVILYYYNEYFIKSLDGKRANQRIAGSQQNSTVPHDHDGDGKPDHGDDQHQNIDEDLKQSTATSGVFEPPSPQLIKQARDLLAENPDDADLNAQLGNLLFDSRRYEEAASYYQKSIIAEPNNADVIVDLGVCYFNLSDFVKAESYFQLAYQKDPNHINALYNLGVVSVQNNKVNDLIKFWSRLQEVAPNSPQAQRAVEMLNSIHQQVEEFEGEKENSEL